MERRKAHTDQPREGAWLKYVIRAKWTTPEEKEWWYTKLSEVRRRKLVKLSEAQNHRCACCGTLTYLNEQERQQLKLKGKQRATLEHIQCQTHGGTDSLFNLAMTCHGCNSYRGIMDAVEFYEIRSVPEAWEEHLRARARVKQENKRLHSVKREERKDKLVLNIALLCMFDSEWEQVLCNYVAQEQMPLAA